ncbi:hypothetical protein [Polyangium jinanense]|uniref:Lipoprotein n=1 Tax=Polyangium jinanense TaxID=2829994 RepID=A0A9X3X007_9BACT|nr:hypothetical protein [Polyangium jinanense]MDC3955266.1 hypothetical protein [Polyangium jinanense]MDC3981567.1 hypothetical protein [Polyangium jinanense]
MISTRWSGKLGWGLSAVLSAAALTGCGHTALKVPSSSGLPKDCEVGMQMVYGDSLAVSGEQMPTDERGVRQSPLASSKTKGSVYLASHPVCMKMGGKLLPQSTITLEMDDARYDHYRLCGGNVEEPKWPGSKLSCAWNGNFRDTHPADFILFAADGKTLAQHLRGVRAFRNGELAFRWVGGPDLEETTISGKYVLVVPGKQLKASFMPHLTQIDLRLVGFGSEVETSFLTEEVARVDNKIKDQIGRAWRGAISSRVFEDARIAEYLSSLQTRSQAIQCRARALLQPDSTDETCPGTKTAELQAREDLTTFYKQLKETAAGDIEDARKTAEKSVQQQLDAIGLEGEQALVEFYETVKLYWSGNGAGQDGWLRIYNEAIAKEKAATLARSPSMSEFAAAAKSYGITIPDELEDKHKPTGAAFLAWFKLRQSGDQLGDILKHGDAIMREALAMTHETSDLMAKIRADVQKVAKDDEARAQLFQDVFDALDPADPFVQYEDNPPQAKGESILSMRYSDKQQFYALAPWYAVSMRVSGDVSVQFNESVLIPVIDVVGSRWQFSRSRFGDFRLALGVANLFEDVPEDERNTTDDKTRYRVVPQLSISAGTVRLGLGYAFGQQTGMDKNPFDPFRVFLGADLVKLISGRNAEVF